MPLIITTDTGRVGKQTIVFGLAAPTGAIDPVGHRAPNLHRHEPAPRQSRDIDSRRVHRKLRRRRDHVGGPGSERRIGESPYSGYLLCGIFARFIILFAGLIPVFLDTGTEFVRLRFAVGSNLLRALSGFLFAQLFCG